MLNRLKSKHGLSLPVMIFAENPDATVTPGSQRQKDLAAELEKATPTIESSTHQFLFLHKSCQRAD
jgi:hypothetical protein